MLMNSDEEYSDCMDMFSIIKCVACLQAFNGFLFNMLYHSLSCQAAFYLACLGPLSIH